MSLVGLTDPGIGRGTNPRNMWSRLLTALDTVEAPGIAERWHLARRIIDSVKYAPDISEETFKAYMGRLEALKPADLPPAPVNGPADYLGHDMPILHRSFRRIDNSKRIPLNFPYGLALPDIVGNQNNCDFLYDAATALNGTGLVRTPRIHVFLDAALTRPDQIAAFLKDLSAQNYDGLLRITLFGASDPALLPTIPQGLPEPDLVASDLLSEASRGQVIGRLEGADIVLFISGSVRLDPTALTRLVWTGGISQKLVHPLLPVPTDSEGMQITPFSYSELKQSLNYRFPYRDMQGLNIAIPADLLRCAGLPDHRFENRQFASQELAFRLYNHGAWFSPLALPEVSPTSEERPETDRKLYISLVPVHPDRKPDHARYETPKVSVYIPTYNAARYIERAVDSVLEQDFPDLEVCLANDGSHDATLDVLERRYGDNPRVTWLANPNGGIGFASNTALAITRGLYIGQLDSDDCLKPGAIRRLAEYLDNNPATVCAYSSCERIDADGAYQRDEYSWPAFSREKMTVTSIAHHFRMFRRAAWERTTKFREDIVNAVDYDIFLKLSETGRFHHIEETFYQRRWHGQNTSNVNEHHQTANTYRVQTEALARQGLDRFWQVDVPDPDRPRQVTFKRKPGQPMALFWPDYSRSNPYQKLLYGSARDRVEIIAGDIDSALRLQEKLPGAGGSKGPLTFHLHWLNFLFVGVETEANARENVDHFLEALTRFKSLGGRLVWTIHNTLSHDSPFAAIEVALSERLVDLADQLHIHSKASIPEIEEAFALDRSKITVSRHGAYVGIYPDLITRDQARALLGYGQDEDIILFTGQIRPYKGANSLISAVRRLLKDRPKARLVLVGSMQVDIRDTLTPALSEAEQARIEIIGRFLDNMEMQVFFRAADLAVYPYQKVLTSGSLLLALSFGVPVVVPDVGMTREVLDNGPSPAGALYSGGEDALEARLREMLALKDAGTLTDYGQAAREIAENNSWPDFSSVLMGPGIAPPSAQWFSSSEKSA